MTAMGDQQISASSFGLPEYEPRVVPAPPSELPADVAQIMRELGYEPDESTAILRTVALAPELFKRWLPFHRQVLHESFDPYTRELIVLRTLWRCRGSYAWDPHVRLAQRAGAAANVIRAIAQPVLDDTAFSAREFAVLGGVDEVHASGCISTATWSALREWYGIGDLITYVLLIGHYTTVSYLVNSTGI